MARDLYGELLARALQRQAPPGHFPAFVTPGEANLLRSRGGGVPPGGGQYMAGGLPAFFSPADPDGDDPAMGMGIGLGGGPAPGAGATGEGDDMAMAMGIGLGGGPGVSGATGEGDDTAMEQALAQAAVQAQAMESQMQAQAQAQAQAQEAAAIAQEMEHIANQQATAQAAAAAQAQNETALAASRAARSVAQAGGGPQTAEEATGTDIGVSVDPGFGSLGVPVDMEDVIGQGMVGVDVPDAAIADQAVADAQAEADDALAANLQTYANIAQAEQAQAMPGNLSADLGAANAALADAIAGAATGSATGGGTVAPGDFASLAPAPSQAEIEAAGMPTSQSAAEGLTSIAGTGATHAELAEMGFGTGQATPVEDGTMPPQLSHDLGAAGIGATGVGVAHDAQGQSIEQQLAEILQTTPYPTPVDPNVGHVADAIALANTATSLAMSEQEAADAHQEAVTTLGQDIDIDPDTGMNRGGIGSRSPGAMWGVNAEVANEDKSNISIAQIQALNATDAQGYAINNPNPSEASLRASLVFAELNPTITNMVIGAMGLMPGTIGFGAFIAGLMSGKGLLNIPAVRAIPGMQALSDIVNIPSSLVSVVTDPFADLLSRAVTGGGKLIGEELSQGEQALQDALRGVIDFDEDFEEPDGFADGEETFGGEPEIEFVPPVAPAEPAPPARTFAEVDEATRNRIRGNIIGGLQRIGRPTEGITAFGPLFGEGFNTGFGLPKNLPEGSGDGFMEIQPFPRNTFT